MVYVAFFVSLITGALISKNSHGSKAYLFAIMAFLFAIIGLRDTTVGADTLGYMQDFYRFSQIPFSELWRVALESREPLYVVISRLASVFSDNTAYLLVWALFPVISLYKVFKAELGDGVDYMIAILVFFMLGLFAFFVAGIRQTAALSLTFLGAVYLTKINTWSLRTFIKDKNLYIFLLYVAVACLIHNSALLFLLAILCLFIKIRWWYLILIIGFWGLRNYVHADQIVSVSSYLFNDRFASYGTGYKSNQNLSAFVMQFILFLICFIVKDKLRAQNRNNDFLLMTIFVGLFFQSLSGIQAEMSRVAYYFSMFAMILVPRAIKDFKPPWRTLIYCGFTAASLLYLFFLSSSNLPEYHSVL